MSCLGVHFAITDEEAKTLRSIRTEEARLEHLQEVIEPHYFEDNPEFKAECDKAWDAIHRALTDGELSWNGGEYPFSHVVLGGDPLYTKPDYIISLKTLEQVRDIATKLSNVSEAEFRQRYFAIHPASYGFTLSEEDFSYTWNYYSGVREFYQRAAAAGRVVLFTADQ